MPAFCLSKTYHIRLIVDAVCICTLWLCSPDEAARTNSSALLDFPFPLPPFLASNYRFIVYVCIHVLAIMNDTWIP